MPSSVRIPFKQHILLETVNREHVQIISYIHFCLSGIEKTTINLESFWWVWKTQQKINHYGKNWRYCFQIFRCSSAALVPLKRPQESVTDNSIAPACNLELARMASVLKAFAPNLHEQRTGFKSADLFFPATVYEIEKKHQNLQRDLGLIVNRFSRQKGTQMTDLWANSRRLMAKRFFVTKVNLAIHKAERGFDLLVPACTHIRDTTSTLKQSPIVVLTKLIAA